MIMKIISFIYLLAFLLNSTFASAERFEFSDRQILAVSSFEVALAQTMQLSEDDTLSGRSFCQGRADMFCEHSGFTRAQEYTTREFNEDAVFEVYEGSGKGTEFLKRINILQCSNPETGESLNLVEKANLPWETAKHFRLCRKGEAFPHLIFVSIQCE